MRNMFIVFKKEIYRVVTDPRLILTVFILPGLSIFLIYSLMGNIISSQTSDAQTYQATLYVENMPDVIDTKMQEQMNFDLIDSSLSSVEINDKIMDGDLDLAIIFDENFTQKIADFETTSSPEVFVYYNQSRQHSQSVYSQFNSIMMQFHEQTVIERLDNPQDYQVYQLASENIMDERAAAGQTFAMLLPMLIIIFLFAGAMSIGPDAIAGEKERGTIATLLVRPIKRSSLALGKVLSLSVLSLISAISSFIGIILSLPRLMQMDDTMPDVSIYGVAEYALILVLLMSTVLFIVGLISIVSAYAKTIKEASMLILPFYFIAMIVGIMRSFGADVSSSPVVHLVPIYGPVNLLSGILTFDYSLMNLMVTILANLLYTVIFVVVLNKMFNSEKFMFQR